MRCDLIFGAIVIFALSVIVCEIFTVEMCMTLTLTLIIGHGHKYANRKAICHFIIVGNCNVCSICHRLRYIHSQNARDLWNGPRSYVSVLIERQYATSYALVIAMFTLFFTDREIATNEMCMILTLTFEMGQG